MEKIIIPFSELTFSASRSGGAGGQNVNKVNSRITLEWNLLESSAISPELKERFILKYKNFLNKDGILQISCQEHRSQQANKEECIKKLLQLLRQASIKPKPRKATKPTKKAIKKRLESKKIHGLKKISRSKNYQE